MGPTIGYLLFGSPPESVKLDDRVLAHLKIVMLTKLRRHEGFPFSFDFDPSAGSGRSTVWLNPGVLIQFRFEGSRAPSINKAWLELMMLTANETDGLRIVEEPEETWTAPTVSATVAVEK
jgi:hypothetical protein